MKNYIEIKINKNSLERFAGMAGKVLLCLLLICSIAFAGYSYGYHKGGLDEFEEVMDTLIDYKEQHDNLNASNWVEFSSKSGKNVVMYFEECPNIYFSTTPRIEEIIGDDKNGNKTN